MSRRAINSADYSVPVDGFSQVVVGRTDATALFVSGITARRADGSIEAEGDMAGQTRQVMENMKRILETAGANLGDVVQIRTFVTDITRWVEIENVWREYWGEVWPASTLVEITRLFDRLQMIEMEAIALIDR